MLAVSGSQQRIFLQKNKMKKLIMVSLFVVLVAAFASSAGAAPVNLQETFEFPFLTFGSHACWLDTFVNTGFPQYDYTWELTQVILGVEDIGWIGIIDGIPDVIDPVPDEIRSGSDTAYGLPFDILDYRLEEPGIFSVDIHIDVDCVEDSEVFRVCADNLIDFGSLDGHAVELFALEGIVTVTAVPEPATIVLLGIGVFALIRNKKRPAQGNFS